MSAESFTILAIAKARDEMSEVYAKMDESLDKFAGTADRAAETARASGAAIDEALGRDVDASDRMDVASARLDAAQAKAAESARALTDAERELLAAQRDAATSADDDSAATTRLIDANAKLTAAQKDAAGSAKAVRDAEAGQTDAMRAAAAAGDKQAAAQLKVRDASDESGLKLSTVGKIAGITALGLGAAGILMVKAAGDFQDSTTHLVTDAGESQKNLAMVQAGILNVSTATGQSAAMITDAMYHIESGGMHGASGLAVLRIAAEGARVGGADLDTVSKTLVGTLNAYGMTSKNAAVQTRMSASVMNQLIATVGAGDMRMQDLASSLSAVAPLAAAVHIKFSQVGGAIATMTAQGMSARQATQDLANTIRGLSNPNNVAIAEMNQLGINAQDVSQHLGQRGLTGTIGMLTKAITDHMGKSGQVLMSAFTQSTTAGTDLQAMLKTMPPQFASLAKSYMDGTVTAKQWRTELQGQTPVNQHLMQQFASLYDKSHSFNSLLAAGGPAAQTYTAALAKMMGGSTGLNTALMLTGKNQAVFAANTATVAAAAAKGGSQVSNWSMIQGTFNFKLAQAKTSVENTGIAIGSALLPAATALLTTIGHIVVPIAEWTAHNRTLTLVLFGIVGGIAATIAILAAAKKAFTAVSGAVNDTRKVLQALGVMSKETAVTQQAAATETAAVQEEAAGEAAAAQETAAEEGAAANETAAAETSSSWLASAATTVGGWAAAGARMAGQAAVWVAQNTVKVAVVVGEQLAAAATTAAAWIAANAAMIAGIGLIVLAVAGAVYLIVTHWNDIVDGVKKAWNAVYDFITRTIDDVTGFVRSHWVLIIELIGGPLAIAVVQIVRHWDDIKRWFSDGVHAVQSVLSWFGSLPGLFGGWLSAAAGAIYSEGARVLGWFSSLPGWIYSRLSVLYDDMLAVGKNIVIGIWNGLASMGSWLWNQISSWGSSVLHGIEHAFGIGSPSKKTYVHGMMLGYGVGNGLLASLPMILSAVRRVSSTVLSATSAGLGTSGQGIGTSLATSAISAAGSGTGNGGVTINLYVTGNTVMSDSDTEKLVARIEQRLVPQILPAAGRAIRG